MHFTSKQSKTNKRVALISTPWPLYNRPSIQLGTLKAYLRSNYPDMQVETHHVYLKLAQSIGYRQYHEISKRTWLAETVYAALLYPERLQQIKKLFVRESDRKSVLRTAGLDSLAAKVKKISDEFINSRNWGDYLLAGFSVSLCQLTSALYFIKRIKEKFPKLIIVIGGSTFSGSTTEHFFKLFPEVNAVINGEGELPISQLIACLVKFPSLAGMPPIKGLCIPEVANDYKAPGAFQQMISLNALPPPDYDDYFDLLKSLDSQNAFFPVLPVETSRGCWWWQSGVSGKASPKMPGRTAGCAFCNLNLQWEGYRTKNASQVVAEINHLTAKHQTLSVSLVDNVLPRKTSTEVFAKLDHLKKDLRLFSEIRATTSWSELKLMAKAGMQEIQIGIEALSTPLLKKLHKGTSAIQNLEIMKNCEALGIENISNLILYFPGSDERDVALSLQNIEFALPYRPLKAVTFWLGRGSPVWQSPKTYGIRAVFNHPNWAVLFPRKVWQNLGFMIQAYRGDLGYQRKIWQPVKKKVASWYKIYTELHAGSSCSPIISLRDSGEFLIIRQRRLNTGSLNHRLTGTSRLIYLFCGRHRSVKKIRDRFPAFAEDKIVAFLKMMVAKKLMFEENDRYLSLAVPVNPWR
jgi:ribosomal peptide maturation radical SAM protein 1